MLRLELCQGLDGVLPVEKNVKPVVVQSVLAIDKENPWLAEYAHIEPPVLEGRLEFRDAGRVQRAPPTGLLEADVPDGV